MYKVINTEISRNIIISPDEGTPLRILYVEERFEDKAKVNYYLTVFEELTDVELETMCSNFHGKFMFNAGVLLAGTFGTEVAKLAWDFLLKQS